MLLRRKQPAVQPVPGHKLDTALRAADRAHGNPRRAEHVDVAVHRANRHLKPVGEILRAHALSFQQHHEDAHHPVALHRNSAFRFLSPIMND